MIARGSITATYISDSYLISGKKINCKRSHQCILEENQPRPLKFVTWFDVAREGLTVEAADGGVKVKTVEDKKPFGKAGLRAGDLIVEVDNEAASSPNVFRQLLRRALTGDYGVRLRICRGSDAKNFFVPSPWANSLLREPIDREQNAKVESGRWFLTPAASHHNLKRGNRDAGPHWLLGGPLAVCLLTVLLPVSNGAQHKSAKEEKGSAFIICRLKSAS